VIFYSEIYTHKSELFHTCQTDCHELGTVNCMSDL